MNTSTSDNIIDNGRVEFATQKPGTESPSLGTDAPETASTYWSSEGPGPRVMAASTLQDDEVKNEAGELLGELREVMIDVPTGRVAYAVLSVGGVLGVGERLFAIPWRALRLDPAAKCFRMDVAKSRFDNAPGFDRDHWPAMADETWAPPA
jgi:sporulation protein YlmC with PRC-barrel domain